MMKDGKPLVWGVETGSAAAMARQGITVDSFPQGTILTVTLHPLRDGRPFGAVGGALVNCGTTMPAGGCNEKTGKVSWRLPTEHPRTRERPTWDNPAPGVFVRD